MYVSDQGKTLRESSLDHTTAASTAGDIKSQPQRPCVLMDRKSETATAPVCGTAVSVAAEELELAGLQVKGPAAFSALSQVANLRTMTLIKIQRRGVGKLGDRHQSVPAPHPP